MKHAIGALRLEYDRLGAESQHEERLIAERSRANDRAAGEVAKGKERQTEILAAIARLESAPSQ